MPGPEREEGEGVLEVAVISRDGTDRQRADYRARPLTFPELHVTAAVGCEPRQSWSVLSPSLPPLSLQHKLALSSPLQAPGDSRFSCRLRSLSVEPAKYLTLQDKWRKGSCDFFTRTYQFSFNHCQKNKNGCLKHFQIPFSYQGENAHRKD